ncbi:hypothetical protein FRB95_011157 [Tulasnella sp. JGI-2019a]|nr:hypothetical protein FRB95_011157 [Tulasnella sp. JGI-2019a]
MERNIWKPLGMNDTTFHLETRPDFGQRRAGLCIRTPNGALVPGPPRLYPTAGSPASDLGGIGLDSTCLDHGKFISAVLCDGCGILKKESIDEIFRPQFTGKTSPHPLYSSFQHHFGRTSGDELTNFGLTVDINVDALPGRRTAGSGSWGASLLLHILQAHLMISIL